MQEHDKRGHFYCPLTPVVVTVDMKSKYQHNQGTPL